MKYTFLFLFLITSLLSNAQRLTLLEFVGCSNMTTYQQVANKIKAKGYRYQTSSTVSNYLDYSYGFRCHISESGNWAIDGNNFSYLHIGVEPTTKKLLSLYARYTDESPFVSISTVLENKGYKQVNINKNSNYNKVVTSYYNARLKSFIFLDCRYNDPSFWLAYTNKSYIYEENGYGVLFPPELKNIAQYTSVSTQSTGINLKKPVEVQVKVIVEPNGSVSDARVVNSSMIPLMNLAKQTVMNLPKFKPGTNCGYPVRMWHTITVTFKP